MDKASILFEKGNILVKLKRAEEATKLFKQALNLEPDNINAIIGLTFCFISTEQYQEAQKLLKVLFSLLPDDYATHELSCYYYLSKRQFSKAIESINESIRLNPENATGYAILAKIYETQSKWELAYDTANIGLAINPTEHTCFIIKLNAARNLEMYGEVYSLIKTILSISPDDSETHAVVGWAMLFNEDVNEAKQHFYESLRIDATNELSKNGLMYLAKSEYFIYRIIDSLFIYIEKIPIGNTFIWGMITSLCILAFTWLFLEPLKLITLLVTSFLVVPLFFIVIKLFFTILKYKIFEPLTNLLLSKLTGGVFFLSNTESERANRAIIILSLFILLLLFYAIL